MRYTINRDMEIELTPEDVARSFFSFTDEDQAHQMNVIGSEFQSWESADGIMQAFYMSDNDILTEEVRWFIEHSYEALGDKPFREVKES